MNLSLRKIRAGFTLTELLVVIIIVSLLSALTLGALRSGGIRAKEDSARSFIVHLSESLLEFYEELDDQGMMSRDTVGSNTWDYWSTNPPLRSYDIRWQLPVTRLDALQRALGNLNTLTPYQAGSSLPPFGPSYNSYWQNIATGGANQSAECLYMIMTQTGYFVDFLETLHATQVADTDGNELNEFIDPWGTAIRLEFSPERPEPDLNANGVLEAFGQLNQEDHNANGVRDTTAILSIQNLPIIHSAGVDQEFGTDDDIMSIDLVNGIFVQ